MLPSKQQWEKKKVVPMVHTVELDIIYSSIGGATIVVSRLHGYCLEEDKDKKKSITHEFSGLKTKTVDLWEGSIWTTPPLDNTRKL